MAIDLINIGQFANDGTGDDLREAFIKINNNFEEIDLREGEKTTAINLGTAGEGIFYQKNGYELEFKKLVAGTDITLESNDNRILINSNGGLKKLLVQSDSGSVILEETADISVIGGANISTSITDKTLTIDYTGPVSLEDDSSPTLSENLDANTYDISNVGTITANNFVGNFEGNLTGTVNGINVEDINQYFDNYFDFGTISLSVNSILEWITSETVIDMGLITNPEPKVIDAGTIIP